MHLRHSVEVIDTSGALVYRRRYMRLRRAERAYMGILAGLMDSRPWPVLLVRSVALHTRGGDVTGVWFEEGGESGGRIAGE